MALKFKNQLELRAVIICLAHQVVNIIETAEPFTGNNTRPAISRMIDRMMELAIYIETEENAHGNIREGEPSC